MVRRKCNKNKQINNSSKAIKNAFSEGMLIAKPLTTQKLGGL